MKLLQKSNISILYYFFSVFAFFSLIFFVASFILPNNLFACENGKGSDCEELCKKLNNNTCKTNENCFLYLGYGSSEGSSCKPRLGQTPKWCNTEKSVGCYADMKCEGLDYCTKGTTSEEMCNALSIDSCNGFHADIGYTCYADFNDKKCESTGYPYNYNVGKFDKTSQSPYLCYDDFVFDKTQRKCVKSRSTAVGGQCYRDNTCIWQTSSDWSRYIDCDLNSYTCKETYYLGRLKNPFCDSSELEFTLQPDDMKSPNPYDDYYSTNRFFVIDKANNAKYRSAPYLECTLTKEGGCIKCNGKVMNGEAISDLPTNFTCKASDIVVYNGKKYTDFSCPSSPVTGKVNFTELFAKSALANEQLRNKTGCSACYAVENGTGYIPKYDGYCAYSDYSHSKPGTINSCSGNFSGTSREDDDYCRKLHNDNNYYFVKCLDAKGGTDTGKASPTPSGPTPTPMPQCHDEKNDRKNYLCGTASKAELAGQKCSYTDKSKAFDDSCKAVSGNTYCYECSVDSGGGIKNVCKENKEGKDQGDFEKYLEPRCGGEKYEYAKALKGEYKGPYSDVYKCSKGDATIEIQESDICTKAPWNLKTGAGTPTPTMSPLLLCPSDGNHACAQYSNCSDTASFPKAKTEGNAACTDFDPRKPFCCTKSTGGTTTTPTTGAATSPSPTTSGGGGTGSCSDKSKLENKCACNPTTDTCSAGLDCVTDWTGSLKHCVNYSTGKYCPAKTDTTPTEAACTGGTPAGGAAATPTTAASTTDTAVACKNAVGTDMNGLAESSQDRNCTDAKAADNSSRCCKTNPKCRTAFGDTYTCKVLQNDRGGPYGNCSTIPLCNN